MTQYYCNDNSQRQFDIFYDDFCSEFLNRMIELYILLKTKRLTDVEICCDVDINLNSRNVEITLYHFQYYKITKAR